MSRWPAALMIAATLAAGCDGADPTDPGCAGKCDGFGGPPDIGDERDERWVFVQSHLHTTPSHDCSDNPQTHTEPCHSGAGVKYFLEAALEFGATDMLITDHNSRDAWDDPAFAPMASAGRDRYATPLRGIEWTSANGHLTIFLPRNSVASDEQAMAEGLIWADGNAVDTRSPEDFARAIAAAHDHGGLAMINHPHSLHVGFEDVTLGADGVEVGTPPNPDTQILAGARAWWQRRLAAGERLTAIAGADHHHDSDKIFAPLQELFGRTVNLVRLDPSLPDYLDVEAALADPEATIDARSDLVADAIRRGHVMVVEDAESPRVYIGADLDGDGDYRDARGGDCIPAGHAAAEIAIRVRVVQPVTPGGSGHYNVLFRTETSSTYDASDAYLKTRLRYHEGFVTDGAYEIDPDDPFALTIKVPYHPGARGLIWVQLNRDVLGPVNDMEALTNPIYFGDWGDECAGSRPL